MFNTNILKLNEKQSPLDSKTSDKFNHTSFLALSMITRSSGPSLIPAPSLSSAQTQFLFALSEASLHHLHCARR